MMGMPALCLSCLALIAVLYTSLALALTLLGARRGPRRASRADGGALPGVSVLKPLHGLEPRLLENLRAVCRQDYPRFELVLGVERPDDPAVAVVQALRTEGGACPVRLSTRAAGGGENPKVRNLAGMLPLARYDVLLLTDADTSIDPDFLRDVVAPLEDPRVGAVTCLYQGVPADGALWTELLTAFVNGFFIPAVRVGSLGRKSAYGLGAAILVRRAVLDRLGGLDAFSDHLSDDFLLARGVERCGLRVALGRPLVRTSVAEASLGEAWDHLVRWMHASRVARPWGFTLSVVMYPVALSALALLFGAGAVGGLLLGLGFLLRLALLWRQDRGILPVARLPLWAVAVDLLACAAWAKSVVTRDVRWHGRRYRLGPGGRMRLHQPGPPVGGASARRR